MTLYLRHSGFVAIVFSLSLGCQKQPTSVTDEPAFQKPSATEAFNLRTKCVELGEKINDEYDLADTLLATNDDLPHTLTQQHFSRYDPKTNRCYVELRASATSGLALLRDLAKLGSAKAQNRVGAFLNNYEVDYEERRLFDGQTGEELASLQRGVKGVVPTGVVKGRITEVKWYDAAKEIDRFMTDDWER